MEFHRLLVNKLRHILCFCLLLFKEQCIICVLVHFAVLFGRLRVHNLIDNHLLKRLTTFEFRKNLYLCQRVLIYLCSQAGILLVLFESLTKLIALDKFYTVLLHSKKLLQLLVHFARGNGVKPGLAQNKYSQWVADGLFTGFGLLQSCLKAKTY